MGDVVISMVSLSETSLSGIKFFFIFITCGVCAVHAIKLVSAQSEHETEKLALSSTIRETVAERNNLNLDIVPCPISSSCPGTLLCWSGVVFHKLKNLALFFKRHTG